MTGKDKYRCEDCGHIFESVRNNMCPKCGSSSIYTIEPTVAPHITGKPIEPKPAVIAPGRKIVIR